MVFQYLATRAPFDDIELRDQFRRRLNAIVGVDIPSAKLALRPNIRAQLITSETALNSLGKTLAWFVNQVQPTTMMPNVAHM